MRASGRSRPGNPGRDRSRKYWPRPGPASDSRGEPLLYVDTSASVKLLLAEDESEALAAFLGAQKGPLLTSRVGVVELRRVGRRGSASADRADAVAASFTVIELDATVERLAVGLDSSLGALDAVHLASALAVGEALTGFVCYDARLVAEAAGAGLPVLAKTG